MKILEAKPATTTAPQPSPETYHGKAGSYASTISFVFPKELMKVLPDAPRYAQRYLGNYTWEFRPSPTGNKVSFNLTNQEYVLSFSSAFEERFARSPAEFIKLEDGTLMVAVPARLPAGSSPFNPGPVKPKPAPAPAPAPASASVDVAHLRALLEQVRAVERDTPYRLIKSRETGEWCFTAPTIR